MVKSLLEVKKLIEIMPKKNLGGFEK